MQVEHVTRVGLASRRPSEQQRQLAICGGLLGQIIKNDQGVLAVVAKVLAHGHPGVRREELQRRRLRGSGRDHYGVVHRAMFLEAVYHLRHRRTLLADGDVYANHVAALLVDYGVYGHRGLAGLSVPDDQLALAAADRDHRIYGLDARLQRLVDRLAIDDAGRLDLDAAVLVALDITQPVYGLAKGVDHPPEQALAHRNLGDTTGALYLTALGYFFRVTEHGRTNVVLFEVQRHAVNTTLKLKQFAQGDAVESVYAGDAVGARKHATGFTDLNLAVKVPYLVPDNIADL